MAKLNFLDKDFKIVENRKIFFLVPLCIIVIALIFMAVNVFVANNANNVFNLSMDFTGGYKTTIKLGERITANTTESIKNDIKQVFADKGIKDVKITTQSEGNSKAMVVAYQMPIGQTEEGMETLNQEINEALEVKLLSVEPVVSVSGQIVSVKYSNLMATDIVDVIKNKLNDANYTVVNATEKGVTNGIVEFEFEISGTIEVDAIKSVLTLEDKYSGQIIPSGRVSGSMSESLVWSAVLSVVVALACMLIYIAIRFRSIGFSAALATVIALAHDILMMFAFMAIFRVELGATFIAAMITILGYSINNTIIIFDRVRENNLLYKGKFKPTEIANRSVKDTFWRSVNTTITTLLTIVCLAIISVQDVRNFALPIIVGLLAGVVSSMCLAPSVWALIQENKYRKIKKSLKKSR